MIFLQGGPKFEATPLPVPEIIGGIQKIWEVHGYAHAPFSTKIKNITITDE